MKDSEKSKEQLINELNQLRQENQSLKNLKPCSNCIEMQLEYFFDFSPELFSIVDFDGIPRFINPRFSELLGYSGDELLKNVTTIINELVHPEDRENLLAVSKRVKDGKYVNGFESRYRCKDGSYKWISWTAIPFIKKGMIYIVASDVTYKKGLEEQLKKSNEEITNILESITDGFYALDNNWCFKYINKETEKVISKKREELIGRCIWEEFPHGIGSVPYQECHSALEKQQPAYFEAYSFILGKYCQYNVYPSKDGLSVYFTDITERKKFEQEMARLSKMNLIGQMAAGIGHEIRNPMTSIRGFLQMLSSKEDCTKYQRYFAMMIEEVDRVNSIITEFLSLAKSRPASLARKNINEILDSIFPLILANAFNSNKNIVLQKGCIPDLLVDEKEIRQLILNLVRNGLEATRDYGQVTISTYLDDQEVILAVADQGKGISSDILEKLGTPFFTTKADGVGLGLAICYSIVERHNSVIDIETSPAGSVFLVRFKQDKSVEL